MLGLVITPWTWKERCDNPVKTPSEWHAIFPVHATLVLRQSSCHKKAYWKIIKVDNKSEVQHTISLDLFEEHFEKLALGNESVNVSNTTGELNNMPPDTKLNRLFTHQEQAVQSYNQVKGL